MNWLTPRRVIYFHLAGVAICCAFSLADRRLFVSVAVSEWLLRYVDAFNSVGLLSLVLCPLVWLSLVVCGRVGWRDALITGVAELLLVVAHHIVLLPACM
ncbi:MAG: hypothetical protein NT069_03735 [Planctomycetota bacterium]|nr:hypothetical protein [Planctomycetota bacterium]